MSLMYSLEKFFYPRNKSIPMFREYDKRRGFNAWSAECQSAAPRGANSNATPNILGEQGFARVRVFSEAEANSIRQQFDKQDANLVQRKNSAVSQTLEATDVDALKQVVAKAITPEVDHILSSYFGSDYAPYWFSMQRALPNKEPMRAFLWHCDKGPTMHAKMLLYFTAVADTGGNTYLMDKKTTQAFDKAGYVFGAMKDRVEDLAPIARENNIAFEPFAFDLRPGEALLFLPQAVLHKGVLPNKAPRFIMQVTFLPSKIQWKDALFRPRDTSLAELAKDYAWPEHASQLRSALGG